ncbi:hypothetical protein OESDEN_15633 [Oesophagostomum dentatum]|uniref:RRM domain-containing protein n=1 Tax=Oesophagostomum dentatum TaxID=61180 RepID=A0A0B1SNB8_OESDE|nr:hypothetical protein OESDEN_15633 [Oesophagostomum dentatum]
MAVKMLNSRIVDGRRLEVSLWDGKTKYKVQETEEERQRRLANWQNYIKGDSDDEDEGKNKEATKTEKKNEKGNNEAIKTDDKDGEEKGSVKTEDREKKEEEVKAEKLSSQEIPQEAAENSDEGPTPEKRPKLDDEAEQ